MLQAESTLFTIALMLYFAATVLYFGFVALRRDRLSQIAVFTQLAALALHTAAIVCRSVAAGRLPMSNQYEFATCFAWGLSLVSLIFIMRFKFRTLGAFASPVTLLIIGYAAMQNREVRELMPALRSSWLGYHVSTAIIAYGAFGVAFVVALLFLLRNRLAKVDFFSRRLPSPEKLDIIGYRSVALGLLFLTFTIITGAIWAEQAWGSYWSWDPKETWSLVTWIVYAIYLHLRLRRNWQGRAAAIFAIVGFACVMFTYVGVNTFLPGVHSYA